VDGDLFLLRLAMRYSNAIIFSRGVSIDSSLLRLPQERLFSVPLALRPVPLTSDQHLNHLYDFGGLFLGARSGIFTIPSSADLIEHLPVPATFFAFLPLAVSRSTAQPPLWR